ncbi:MAG: helix-turn-helix domain-containing protein [Haloarculaceae archaeon]
MSVNGQHGLQGRRQAVESDAVFDVLANPGCREIVRTIGDATLTAAEVGDRIDAPMSSIYRHLEALTETRILEESVRINPHGRNQNQYSRRVSDVSVSIAEDFDITLF